MGTPKLKATRKALIYDPYLDTFGGGERYCLTVAEGLLKNGWEVDLFWDKTSDLTKAIERFDLDLEKVKLIGKKPEQLSFWARARRERTYDLIFWLSDGSIPFLFAKKNLLHFQVPFNDLPRRPINRVIEKIKLGLIDKIICNSKFTKRFIDRTYGVNSIVLYPPVDVEKISFGKKENIILAVGRFEETMQKKGQDVLIQAFIKMINQGLKDWRLVLIGASSQVPGKNQYLKRLKQMARGYPIEFLVNISFQELRDYYQRAKIFWHAAGFGVDEKKEPHRVEHFGITTVEAMAGGCVPIVIDKGGLREIVRRGIGERWKTIEELIVKTLRIIENKNIWEKCALKARQESLKFSKERFLKTLGHIINEG